MVNFEVAIALIVSEILNKNHFVTATAEATIALCENSFEFRLKINFYRAISNTYSSEIGPLIDEVRPFVVNITTRYQRQRLSALVSRGIAGC